MRLLRVSEDLVTLVEIPRGDGMFLRKPLADDELIMDVAAYENEGPFDGEAPDLDSLLLAGDRFPQGLHIRPGAKAGDHWERPSFRD